MKNKNIYILILAIILICTGCSAIKGVFGKNSTALAKQSDKIDAITEKQHDNVDDKMTQVSFLSAGIDYSLKKVTNTEPAVIIAKDLNDRVLSLAGYPSLVEQQLAWKMVDELIASNKNGEKLLKERDIIISELQLATVDLEKQKNVEVKKQIDMAAAMALKSDETQAQLNSLQGNWGLNAMWFGIKTFIHNMLWTLTIFSIIYIVLRFASMSNPLAASIFSIVDVIGGWFVNIIKTLAPKAIEASGHIAMAAYNNVEGTLTKVVDAIQMEKEKGNTTVIEPVTTAISKSFNETNAAIVTDIKKKLLY